VQCQYGDDSRVWCRPQADCGYTGSVPPSPSSPGFWEVSQGPSWACGTQGTCPGAIPQKGAPCSGSMACAYGDTTCSCNDTSGPCSGCWTCAPRPPAPCPTFPPNLGTSCSGTTICDYGTCSQTENSLRSVSCQDGVWTAGPHLCARAG
jgi:hypothetical protein